MFAEVSSPTDSQTVNWILSHPEMEVFVAADSLDKAVGVLAMSHRPKMRLAGRIATIDELVVLNAWRRKGVGRELVKRAVERARVLGVKRVELQNMSGTKDIALGFYAACGFTEGPTIVFSLK